MGRSLLYVPPGGAVFELISSTLQGRYLLRPGRQLNEILLGVLGRSQRLYGVEIFAAAFLSNHFHMLVFVETPEQLSGFMQYFKGNLAREAGRLSGWREKFWGRRYRPIQVSDEETAQVARLRYILAQACKEGLVASPFDWPGVHCARALVEGTGLTGLWYDRTRQFYARRRGEKAKDSDFATPETVVFQPLPCWAHLSPEEYQAAVLEIVREIEHEAARAHAEAGTEPLGVVEILRQNRRERPLNRRRSPAPRFHAATKAARQALAHTYALVYAAYREATGKLKRGLGPVEFPAGCFPPRLPLLQVPYQLVPG